MAQSAPPPVFYPNMIRVNSRGLLLFIDHASFFFGNIQIPADGGQEFFNFPPFQWKYSCIAGTRDGPVIRPVFYAGYPACIQCRLRI